MMNVAAATTLYSFQDGRLSSLELAPPRPIRWASWHPDGSWCLLVGNGGSALRFDGRRLAAIDTATRQNLRGAAFCPDGKRALLAGNRGTLFLLEGDAVRPLASGTTENLRRIAWHPAGNSALIVGNSGTVLRYDRANDAVRPIPGDRAHTLRAVAWRPDGSYALIGAYASRFAGYPRPHPLYKCDGMYLQALLHSDDEDDLVAVDWHPNELAALIVGYAYGEQASNKVLVYDGHGFSCQAVEASGALLGGAWRPDGAFALLCGETGALLTYTNERLEQLPRSTKDSLVGPFWRPDSSSALLLRGPSERVYTV
jgi:hypothetical protein